MLVGGASLWSFCAPAFMVMTYSGRPLSIPVGFLAAGTGSASTNGVSAGLAPNCRPAWRTPAIFHAPGIAIPSPATAEYLMNSRLVIMSRTPLDQQHQVHYQGPADTSLLFQHEDKHAPPARASGNNQERSLCSARRLILLLGPHPFSRRYFPSASDARRCLNDKYQP